jgi:aldehyde:ferredoxin oxidoreductase
MKGYGGRILFVDVTDGRSHVAPLTEAAARALLGGNGLAARILLDHVPAGTDPFDPANAVVFAVGPITDTTVPGNSRACVASKSPLTGLFFDSTFGGRFPATLKRTGFDAVVISGRASAPSYVLITEAGAELKPARELWGSTTRDAVHALVAAANAATPTRSPSAPRASIASASPHWRTTGKTARASPDAAASAPCSAPRT